MEPTIEHDYLVERLENITCREPHTIRNRVAQEALGYPTTPYGFFKDLLSQGCRSYVVSSLILQEDIHAFFKEYDREIWEMWADYHRKTGKMISFNGDWKTELAWLVFEETAWDMSRQLRLGL